MAYLCTNCGACHDGLTCEEYQAYAHAQRKMDDRRREHNHRELVSKLEAHDRAQKEHVAAIRKAVLEEAEDHIASKINPSDERTEILDELRRMANGDTDVESG